MSTQARFHHMTRPLTHQNHGHTSAAPARTTSSSSSSSSKRTRTPATTTSCVVCFKKTAVKCVPLPLVDHPTTKILCAACCRKLERHYSLIRSNMGHKACARGDILPQCRELLRRIGEYGVAIHPPAPEAVPESTVGLNKRSASERSESRGTSASSTIVSAAAMGLPHQLPLHHLHHHAHHLAQHSTQHHFPQLHHRHPAQQQQQHQQHHGLWMGDAGLTAGVDHTLGATHDATASAPHARTHHLPVQMMPMAGYGQPYATASRSTSATTASAAMSAPSSASSASSITRGRHFAAPGSGGMAMAMPSGHVSASHAGGAGAGAGAGAYAASAWNQGPAAVSAFVHTGGTQHHGAVARAPMGSYVGGSANTSPAHSDHNSYDGHDAVAAAAAAAKLDAARPAWARRSDTSEGILEEMVALHSSRVQSPQSRSIVAHLCVEDPSQMGLHFIKKRQRLSRSTHRAVQQHKRVKLDIEVNTSDGVPAALGVVMFVMVQARDLSTRGRVTKVFVPSEPKTLFHRQRLQFQNGSAGSRHVVMQSVVTDWFQPTSLATKAAKADGGDGDGDGDDAIVSAYAVVAPWHIVATAEHHELLAMAQTASSQLVWSHVDL